jgi:flagellar hook-associated protein 1 FlgK
MTLQAKDASGRIVAERTVTVTGATWGDMRAALNAPGTGFAPYGGVSMDANGQMSLIAAAGYSVAIISDVTSRSGTGASMSNIFGLAPGDNVRRAMALGINPEITGDPRRLAVAGPDLMRDVGARVIEAGDGRGAARLADVRNRQTTFPQAGEIGAHRATMGSFTTRLGAEAGRLAVLSERQVQGAEAIKKVAVERRASVEGVSIDDEVIRMNAYQQAYAAAARVIQAANEMWQTLLAIR